MGARRYASGHIRAIAEATDHDTAMTVALEWGGRRIRIPNRASPYCSLSRLVGQKKAEQIVANLGGEVIYVPHEKENLVHWLREKGASRQDIAHELRMARRSVQHIISGTMPRLGPQGGEDADPVS